MIFIEIAFFSGFFVTILVSFYIGYRVGKSETKEEK